MILSDSELVEMLREPRTRREGFAVLVKQYTIIDRKSVV